MVVRRTSSIPPDPNQLLSAFGRAVSEIPPENAEAGIEEQLSIVGPAIDVDRLEIWRVSRPSQVTVPLARWAEAGVEPLEPELTEATASERLSKSLAQTGTAVVPREWIEEHASHSTWATNASKVVVSVIDRESGPEPESTEVTVLLAVPTTDAIMSLVTSVMSDLAVHLKQFNRRIRVQQRLSYLLEVERQMGAVAHRLGGRDVSEDVINEALEGVRSVLDASAMIIVEWLGDRRLRLSGFAGSGTDRTLPFDFEIPDVDGADVSAAIEKRFGRRTTESNRGRAALLLDQEPSSPFLHLVGEGSVTTVPAGSDGRCLVGAVRDSERPFQPEEVDALTSFGVVIGQARERLAAEAAHRFRLESDDLLADAAVQLADASPSTMDDDLRDVLRRFAEHLGLDGIALWAVEPQAERYRAVAFWEQHDELYPRFPPVRHFGDREPYDAAQRTGVTQYAPPDWPRAGLADRVVIPVGSGERVDHLLVAGAGRVGERDLDVERSLAELARLLTHAASRLEAERHAEVAFDRSPVGIVISEEGGDVISANAAGLELIGASHLDEVLGRSYRDFMQADAKAEWSGDVDRTVARIPLERPDGTRWIGRFENRRLDDADPSRWLSHITDITAEVRADEALRFAATHDALTGLLNRPALLDAISQLAGEPDPALLLLDLDRFKNVNDSLGHLQGDELLLVIADRLRLAMRPGQICARIGGDEFAILIPAPTDIVDAGGIAERILQTLAEPVELGGGRQYPTASIGIAIAPAADPDGLIRKADVAMYQAKDGGRARAVVFDDELQRMVDDRHRIETAIRDALADDRIEVHYQPEVSLITGQVLGAEALVRCRELDGSIVPAGDFIEVAEQAGLIHEIGARVLDLACAEAATWPGGADAPMVRVNLSADQLHRDDIVSTITKALATHGLPARRLCLEITESAAMRDTVRSEQALHELRDLGVELAIDDFGTGYSSLAYLKRFPFHTLKIDRSFVNDLEHDLDDVAFVGSIVYLARSLGLEVVAEGIETEGQAEALRGLGCTRGQGYHFAKPAPAAVLRTRLGV